MDEARLLMSPPRSSPRPRRRRWRLAYEEIVAGTPASRPRRDLWLVFDLPVELAVEIGRTTMTIRETLAIAPGTLIQLNRMAGEPVDLLVNGQRIARGEVVAIDEEFGLRVTEIVSPRSRADGPGVEEAHERLGRPFVVAAGRARRGASWRAEPRICEMRDSVTPSMRPISAPGRPWT